MVHIHIALDGCCPVLIPCCKKRPVVQEQNLVCSSSSVITLAGSGVIQIDDWHQSCSLFVLAGGTSKTW